jgi:hypothetical protein
MSLEIKIQELTTQIEDLSITVTNLTYALKGEMNDHLTDAILYLAKEMELKRKNDAITTKMT